MEKPAPKKKWNGKGKHPGGRPTDYNPEYAKMVEEIVRIGGFSIPKLAKVFQVDRATIYNWMKEHAEFFDGVDSGRRVFEGLQIERGLVRKAVGIRYTETTQEPDQTGEMKTTRKVRKYIPPDVNAIKHWQVNRDQSRWKDRHDVDLTDSRMVQDILAALPSEIAEGVKAAIKAKGKK